MIQYLPALPSAIMLLAFPASDHNAVGLRVRVPLLFKGVSTGLEKTLDRGSE